MRRTLVSAAFLLALLLPLGTTARAGPLDGPGSLPGARDAGGARPAPVDPPVPPRIREPERPVPAPEGPAGGDLKLPPRPEPRPGAGIAGGGDGPALPAEPGRATEATPDRTGIAKTEVACAAMLRPPRLELREPSSAGTPVEPAKVHLARHSLGVRMLEGVAVTELDQVFHNAGGRVGEGTWTCPLPAGAVVTGFSIYIGREEHAGRFLTRAEARRIYDETVRKRLDPGIAELGPDGSLRIRIFPIPAGEDMRIRTTWVHPIPDSGSGFHFRAPLEDLAPSTAPPLERLSLSAELRSTWSVRSVLTPGIALDAAFSVTDREWRGKAVDENCRPAGDLEVCYLLDTDSPRLAVFTEKAADGGRYFLAVVHAGSEPLRDVALDLGGAGTADLFPARIGDVPARSRRLVLGRLTGGLPSSATLRARSGREDLVLRSAAARSGGEFVGALWGRSKIDDLLGGAAPDSATLGDVLDLAAGLRILTPWNAILAEE